MAHQREARATLSANSIEAALLVLLSHGPTHVDDLTRAAGLSSSLVTSTLTPLALKGLARQLGGIVSVRA